MPEKTDPSKRSGVSHRVSGLETPSSNPLRLVRDFLVRLSPGGRGLLLLLLLLLALFVSAKLVFPRRVVAATAPAAEFSGERAMAHLPVIASEPHPQRSPAQARVRDYLMQELGKLGLEVELQSIEGLENVVARKQGSDSTGAIVILAHYDSVFRSPGAADNGAGVAALLEMMRALVAGPALRNDVIALFDDGEELPGAFSGSRAFVRKHPWMETVQVAISLDTAVAGPISTNETGPNNGQLIAALARAHTGGAWTSFSGGGGYNSTPFREAGVLVLALEDNYPFKEQHTPDDRPEIVRASSVQQMGEQTLAIARELGNRDLSNPWGPQETFFPIPLLGLAHYPETWALPLAIAAGVLLVLALGLALWRGFASWRGLAVALAMILVTAVIAGGGVNALLPYFPKIFGWKTSLWPEWPEVIPPYAALADGILALLVLAIAIGGYLLARRWSARADFSLVGMLPFLPVAVALALTMPRAAYAFSWPVLIGSLAWIAAAAGGVKPATWAFDLVPLVAALPLIALLVPFLPGTIMADGMNSVAILAAVEALILGVLLPVVDGIFKRGRAVP